jgi:hypothetical protein
MAEKCFCGKEGDYSSILRRITCKECFNEIWEKAHEDDGAIIKINI